MTGMVLKTALTSAVQIESFSHFSSKNAENSLVVASSVVIFDSKLNIFRAWIVG